MDKIFVRNFSIFVVVLLLCVTLFLYYFISNDRALGRIDNWVNHTNVVISEAENLSSSIQGMVVAQRGFLLSKDPEFLNEYNRNKNETQKHINKLKKLTVDNASQQKRIFELDLKQKVLTKNLENRVEVEKFQGDFVELSDIEVIRDLKNAILKINKNILFEEYSLLDHRVNTLNNKKSQYLVTLIGGVIVGAILLLIFNAFLLKAQRRKASAEDALKDSEDRFSLALQGTRDGIYDWDIDKNEVFYSSRYFSMLGYKSGSQYGTPDDFKKLIHPDDLNNIWDHVQKYLRGEIPEYECEFRLKHADGQWLWVQSRAKGLFKNDGTPYRMVGAHTDISHLKREKEKLEYEKDKAEEANKAKGEFLAHMSHEIRTPLTAISGIAEIFLNNLSDFNERHQKLVSTLSASSSSLKDIVNDVLDFSKIESGDIEIEDRMFLLDDIFAEVTSMMSVKASQENINFVLDDSKTKDVQFYGDKARLRQILVNLIGNSLKFTDAGGLVKITSKLEYINDQQNLFISVSDTGIGIKSEDFDSIFDRFKQADASVSRKYGGTGLGLPISKNLTKLMGGDIYLSSQYGDGSTFSIVLPMKVSHDEKINNGDDLMTQKTENKLTTIEGQKKLLLVEDYSGNIDILSYILEEIKISFDVARNGEEAVNLWQKNNYDLILMDVQMPIMDGFTATQKIRELEANENLSRTPIIGMTAHALVGDKDKCIEAGMDSYLPKPIDEKNLIGEIFSQINKKDT